MLPVPSAGIGGIEFPNLPPRPSGPNPSGPGAFSSLYDRLSTKEEATRGLPTQMEIAPILAPAQDMSTPFVNSPEFPKAVGPDGLLESGPAPVRKADAIGELLKPFGEGLNEVNRLNAKADALTQEAAVGGDVDLHDVMIATEKAGVATQLTLQIRNKLVEAYQDVMRMQV